MLLDIFIVRYSEKLFIFDFRNYYSHHFVMDPFSYFIAEGALVWEKRTTSERVTGVGGGGGWGSISGQGQYQSYSKETQEEKRVIIWKDNK